MDYFKKWDLTPIKVLKIAGIAIAIVVALAFAIQIVGATFQSFTHGYPFGISGVTSMIAPTPPAMGGGYGNAGYDMDYAKSEAAYMPQLSTRNVASTYMPRPSSPVGDQAEEYEVTQYNAQIETRKLSQTCTAFEELKKRQDVIFENANTSDTNCSYTFKVKHDSVEGVLKWLKDLRPKNISEDTYTIKSQIDDFTDEVAVLEKKRMSIDSTLASALAAYDSITALATRTENADALAKIIDSKIKMIERLTQEKIQINEQLDRLSRAKAEQIDRLDYTYFYVNVYESKYVNFRDLGDSWKQAIREFVVNLNTIIQNMTINLILVLFVVIQWAIYALIALFVAKYGWQVAKYIWRR